MQRLGRYELGRILGSGGSGRVQEAVLCGPGGLRKPVALKILHQGSEELRREARIGGLLRHRHLVDVYEVGCVDGTWFCAMERCDGTLAAHVPLPPRAVVEVGLAVCEALHYAHEELGLVHLDLKPENLLLKDGVVKVADLGIARAEGFADDGRIRGTRGFMAPEQARGEPVDAKADVYALAVTLLELAGTEAAQASATMDWASESPWTQTRSPETLTTAEADDSATLALDGLTAQLDTARHGETDTVESATRWAGLAAASGWLAPVLEPCLSPSPAQRPRMAELARTLRALQLDGPGLAEHLGIEQERTVEIRRHAAHNLGEEPDAFIGREAERRELAAALAEPGLVAIKGPAGVGKSRLARAAARDWRSVHGGQAWICDLAEVRDTQGLVGHVARTLDVPLGRGDAVQTLGHALAGRGPLLLLLDNADGTEGLDAVAARWSARADGLRLLLTARARTGLEGARVHELGVLPAAAAQALLVARALDRGVDVAEDPDLPALAERLDGLPLALELAAGRLGVLSVRDVLERLDLSLLRRGTEGRHGTLHAALDWSWDQLDAAEQAGLAQLSVFAGGFTLPAAEAVLALPVPVPVLDLVDRLLAKSWLGPRGERFAMLESMRAYAAARLEDRGAETRHGAWCARLDAALGPQGNARRMQALAAELRNLETACRRAVARGDGTVATATLELASEVVDTAGPFALAEGLAREVGGMELSPAEHARVLRVHGNALRGLGRMDEAGAAHRAALSIHRARGDTRSEGIELGHLGAQHLARGEPEAAEACYTQALALHRQVGNRRSEAISHGHLALALHARGELDAARAHYEAALAIAGEVGNRRQEGIVLSQLAVVHRVQGRSEAALAGYEAALSILREVGDRILEGVLLGNLGILHRNRGAHREARACYDRALALHREVGNRRSEGVVLGNLGDLHEALGELEPARERYTEALRIHDEVDNRRQGGWTRIGLALVEAQRGALDAAHDTLDAARPLLEALGHPGFLAAMHAARAEVHARAGELQQARAALDLGRRLAPADQADAQAALARAAQHVEGR